MAWSIAVVVHLHYSAVQWALGRRKARGANTRMDRARREGTQPGRPALNRVGLRRISACSHWPRLGACFVSSVFPIAAPEIFTHAVVVRFGTYRLTSAWTALHSLLVFSSSISSPLFFANKNARAPAPVMRASAQVSVSGYFSGWPNTGFALS
jgi:hypothetical protein